MLGAADGLGEEGVRIGETARWAVSLSAPPLAQLPGLSPEGMDKGKLSVKLSAPVCSCSF